jgi:hypothetical protein
MVFSSGLIDLGLILLLGFVGFIYSNILKFPFNSFWNVKYVNIQHVCISSHIGLLTVLYCCICIGSSQPVIILTSILYIGVCSYLHFNVYNQAIKPTLFEFLTLLFFIVCIYITGTVLLYKTFLTTDRSIN